MSSKEAQIYECFKCGELVKDGDVCCEPKTFDGYECEGCGELYEDRNEAEDCCPDPE